MPITIAPAPDLTTIGPGLPLQLSSNFIGPFPSDSQWHLDINLDADFVKPFLSFTHPCTGPIIQLNMFIDKTWAEQRKGWTPIEDRIVVVEARITTNTGTIDSGTNTTLHWDGQTGLSYLIEAQSGTTPVEGGFTESDRQLLSATEQRSTILGEVGQLVVKTASGPVPTTLSELFSRPLLDTLTLDELTTGPTCDPVRVRVADWYFGVIVRVTTVADGLVPKTPDGSWYFPDLAVLRIFRGADLEYRRGIHETSFMVEKPWQWGWQVLNVARFFGVAADYTIAVDWREGCCGQVFLQRFP